MNDAEEIADFKRFATRRIKKQIQHDADRANAHDVLREALSGDFLVASFTERRDALSLWRGYGPEMGVSFGFKRDVLNQIVNRHGFRLEKCIYERKLKRAALDKAFVSLTHLPAQTRVKLGVRTANSQMNAWFRRKRHAISELRDQACLFKHPSFFEEEEWRLVAPPSNNSDFVRKVGDVDVPFDVFAFSPSEFRRSLHEIILWPRNRAKEIRLELRDRSVELGIDKLYKQSVSPYRTVARSK